MDADALGRVPARCAFGAMLAVLSAAYPAAALVVLAEDAEVTLPPADFPYWEHVGRSGIVTALYLGRGWVLTAGHAGAGRVELRGQSLAPESGTVERLRTGEAEADLVMFRLRGDPGLPSLPIAREAAAVGTPVLLLGCGGGARGAATSWEGIQGFLVRTGEGACRWGGNRVSGAERPVRLRQFVTASFYTDLSLTRGGVRREAQGATGDSGGGVFSRSGSGGRWELAGLMISVSHYPRQPPGLVLDGNQTHVADLARYRQQILATTAPAASPSTHPEE